MTRILHDLRFTLRQMRKNPGFAAAVVLCLAVGIGANVALFEFARGTLSPDLPLRDRDRIVRIYTRWAGENGFEYGSVSIPDYEDWRDRMTSFESTAVETFMPVHVSTGEKTERTWGTIVSGNYFHTLGVGMELGRDFLPEEYAQEGSHPVLILSYGYWQSRFGGDPAVIGSTVRLNGDPFTVVGVADRRFRSGQVGFVSDLWVPLEMRGQILRGYSFGRGNHFLMCAVARLAPGATLEQARGEMDALMAGLEELYPDTNKGAGGVILSERASSLHPIVRPGFQAAVLLLMVVCGLLLLLTCANVAGLVLARSAARRRELGVRRALGAGRGTLVGQMLVESLVYALLAGGVGYLLSLLMIPLTNMAQPTMDIPMEFGTDLSPASLWFTPLLAVVAAFLLGLLPALEMARTDVVGILHGGRTTGDRHSHRLRHLLVAGQVAASMVLLIGSGLVLRSLRNARNIDPGFDPGHQVVATFDLDLQGYDEARGRQFYRELKQRLAGLPGVRSVGMSQIIPLNLSMSTNWVWPEGWESPDGRPADVSRNQVDEGYFEAMGVRILRGTGFETMTEENARRALVVNQAFVDRYWPGQDPIGRTVRYGNDPDAPIYEVIGLTGTGKYFSLGEKPTPYMYRPFQIHYDGAMNVHVRTDVAPESLFGEVRRILREMDPDLPVAALATMQDKLDFALLPARAIGVSITIFAVLALLLAALGLWGLIAYSVVQQTREIGIRIALGARPGQVLAVVMGRGLVLVVVGAGIGLVLGVLGASAVSGMLYDVGTFEPVSFLAALGVLVAATLLASWLPARRAMKVDPVRVLNAQ
jgi:macrolide transport system ATP-binding/permease protein